MMESIYKEIALLSEKIVKLCSEKGKKVSTAESCTGGMISSALTSVSGSSAVIELGICSYSNRIKEKVLEVSHKVLESESEYSINCAVEMARGAAHLSGSDYAVSTTGVAGPTGGSDEHPVGEVFIGILNADVTFAERYVFSGDRQEVRAKACCKALELLLTEIETDRGKNNVQI
ncbi:MAG: CinA family protein [Oscillospiraceae bacterium]